MSFCCQTQAGRRLARRRRSERRRRRRRHGVRGLGLARHFTVDGGRHWGGVARGGGALGALRVRGERVPACKCVYYILRDRQVAMEQHSSALLNFISLEILTSHLLRYQLHLKKKHNKILHCLFEQVLFLIAPLWVTPIGVGLSMGWIPPQLLIRRLKLLFLWPAFFAWAVSSCGLLRRCLRRRASKCTLRIRAYLCFSYFSVARTVINGVCEETAFFMSVTPLSSLSVSLLLHC